MCSHLLFFQGCSPALPISLSSLDRPRPMLSILLQIYLVRGPLVAITAPLSVRPSVVWLAVRAQPVATVSVPLRNVPVMFPSNNTPPPDPDPAARPDADAGGGPPDAVASVSDLPADSARNSDGSRRRRSLFGERGWGGADRGGSRSPVPNRRSAGSGEWRDQTAPWENLGEPRPRA